MAEQSGVVFDEVGNACIVKYAFANVTTGTTDGAVVAAVAGKRIRVLSYVVETGGTATTVVFNTKPAGAGTAISMTMQNAANGGVERSLNEHGYFQTNLGEGLTVTTGGGGSTTGVQVTYIEVGQ